MADNWGRKVSLVVMLIDDMTDKVIREPARVWIEGRPAPIRKTEGYYVFTDLPGEKALVRIQQGMYEARAVETELPGPGEPYIMRRVRLTPGRCYRLPSGATCVEGKAEPGSRICLFSKKGAKGMKLLYDYDGSEEDFISIYHPAEQQLEGKLLYIEGKDGKTSESFRILARDEEEGRYRLEKPLNNHYKKIGATIYPVYETEADSKGSFFLPILKLGGEAVPFLGQAFGTDRIQKEFLLTRGAVNRVSLLKEE